MHLDKIFPPSNICDIKVKNNSFFVPIENVVDT